ncbi:hypothetical protein HaLaN_08492 [Haematococcus lacustris]|uniref:Uncharacterized protein n=1 Tax=Haematococcus lacustris TaxID=44745 RepID=A0A699YZA5_HAELA|nr:hypothetical protein HaLaN_08492 [Haematococcus lacustris]
MQFYLVDDRLYYSPEAVKEKPVPGANTKDTALMSSGMLSPLQTSAANEGG